VVASLALAGCSTLAYRLSSFESFFRGPPQIISLVAIKAELCPTGQPEAAAPRDPVVRVTLEE
jgi:hypothetical protein